MNGKKKRPLTFQGPPMVPLVYCPVKLLLAEKQPRKRKLVGRGRLVDIPRGIWFKEEGQTRSRLVGVVTNYGWPPAFLHHSWGRKSSGEKNLQFRRKKGKGGLDGHEDIPFISGEAT